MDETFGGWTNWKGNAGRTGVADAGPTGEPVELWRVGASGDCKPSPAIIVGVVYAACLRDLFALDAATGAERWHFEGVVLDGVSVAGGLVYVNDFDADGLPDVRTNVLRALDAATGQELWHVAISAGSDPVVDDGLAVIGTGDGFLVGLDAATGAERWRFQVSTEGGASNPALADGIAYAGGAGGGFFAVDAVTGALLWRGDTGDDASGSTVVAEGLVYAGGSPPDDPEGGHLYAFDAMTGTLRWRIDRTLFTPTVRDGVGYSAGPVGIVTAFDTADGTERWHTQLDGFVHNVAIAGDVVYAVSDHGELASGIYALDSVTGDQLWSFALPSWVHAGLAVAGGVVYVGTEFNGVLAIGGTDQGAVAATTSPSSSPDMIATTGC